MMMPERTASSLRIAVLGSGKGSTADALISWQEKHSAAFATVRLICTSERSGLVEVGQRHHLPVTVIPYVSAASFAEELTGWLRADNVDLLVLAGFLKLLPSAVIAALDGRVINTHPALLPRHGGPGMYGLHVHRAVLAAGDAETGVSVHWVTDQYDAGSVIAQKRVAVMPDDTPEALQERVKQVEGGFLATTIDQLSKDFRRRTKESG